MTQPSAALQQLICGEKWKTRGFNAFQPLRLNPQVLMDLPVVEFAVGRRDLHVLRQKLEAAIRINTVRQYALEVCTCVLRF